MSLMLASLRDQPTRRIPMVDGRRLGVASCTLTSGATVVALVAPGLLDAFEIARADLAATPGALRLTLAERADGHLQIHSVDTDAVIIDGGRTGFAAIADGVDLYDLIRHAA